MIEAAVQWFAQNAESIGKLAAVASAAFSAVAAFNSSRLVRSLVRTERMSVRPIAQFTFGDYEDQIYIVIENNGSGPLLLDRFEVVDSAKMKPLGESIVYAAGMPWSELYVVDFIAELKDRTLRAGQSLTLFSVKGGEADQDFRAYRDEIRSYLATVTLRLHYRDVYDVAQPVATRSGAWFARHSRSASV